MTKFEMADHYPGERGSGDEIFQPLPAKRCRPPIFSSNLSASARQSSRGIAHDHNVCLARAPPAFACGIRPRPARIERRHLFVAPIIIGRQHTAFRSLERFRASTVGQTDFTCGVLVFKMVFRRISLFYNCFARESAVEEFRDEDHNIHRRSK